VTAFVDVATVRAARDRAAQLPLAATEQERWDRTVAYATAHAVDPSAERARELAGLLGIGDAPVADVFGAAGRVLAGELTGTPGEHADDVRRRCVEWFDADVQAAAPLLELFTGHHQDPAGGPPRVDPELLRRLGTWLGTKLGRAVEIEQARMISGGFSRLMLDVEWTGGRGVVRIEQYGMFGTEGGREVAAMTALREAGYPVPAVLWAEDDSAVLGNPFFVMEFVDGAARTDDAGVEDMLRSVAELHRLDGAVVDRVAALDGVAAGAEAELVIDAQLQHWRELYLAAVGCPIPLLERGFAWLAQHLRPTGPPVVVHGDPGPGNALQHDGGVAAVIDWEFAHAGDAAEDWAYLLIRGRRLASPTEWKARIAATVGVGFSDDQWLAWEVYNNVKGACVNLTALGVFARTPQPNPDLLAIGIAVHLRFLSRVVDLTGARG
jgi:aminoglycoside phosphotransferase (APT) family kinase protein